MDLEYQPPASQSRGGQFATRPTAPAPIERIRGRVRARLLVKAPKGVPLQDGLKRWREAVKVPSSVRVAIDIDPQSFL